MQAITLVFTGRILKVAGLLVFLVGASLLGYGLFTLITSFNFNPLGGGGVTPQIQDVDGDGEITTTDVVIQAQQQKSVLDNVKDFLGWSDYDTGALFGSMLYANETGDWLAPVLTWGSIAKWDWNPLVSFEAQRACDIAINSYVLENLGLDRVQAVTLSTTYELTATGVSALNPFDDQWQGYAVAGLLAQEGYTEESMMMTAYTYYQNNLWNRIGGLDGNPFTGW